MLSVWCTYTCLFLTFQPVYIQQLNFHADREATQEAPSKETQRFSSEGMCRKYRLQNKTHLPDLECLIFCISKYGLILRFLIHGFTSMKIKCLMNLIITAYNPDLCLTFIKCIWHMSWFFSRISFDFDLYFYYKQFSTLWETIPLLQRLIKRPESSEK